MLCTTSSTIKNALVRKDHPINHRVNGGVSPTSRLSHVVCFSLSNNRVLLFFLMTMYRMNQSCKIYITPIHIHPEVDRISRISILRFSVLLEIVEFHTFILQDDYFYAHVRERKSNKSMYLPKVCRCPKVIRFYIYTCQRSKHLHRHLKKSSSLTSGLQNEAFLLEKNYVHPKFWHIYGKSM